MITEKLIKPDTTIQGRYRIQECIGHGGMGAVYKSVHESLGHTVALKQTIVSGEKQSKAFEHEAKLLATLRHPVLPRVTDFFSDPNGQFLVMDFIPGTDLDQLLKQRKKPLSVTDVIQWTEQLLDALHYLHTQDTPVVHRDIKPHNIKLTPDNRIFLLDFGLSKGLTDPKTQMQGFTLNYAPPEQIQGHGTEPRSDLYALSATLYKLLTNTLPTPAMERVLAVFVNNQPDPHKPIHSINPQVPTELSLMLEQSMSLRTNDRPPDARTMQREIQTIASAIVDQIDDEDTLTGEDNHSSLPPPAIALDPADQAVPFPPPPATRPTLPASTQKLPLIETPDGKTLTTLQELLRWCEQNWDLATEWLYSRLPGLIRLRWGHKELAEYMTSLTQTYANHMSAGLDTLLAELDPDGFGKEQPQLVLEHDTLDCGKLSLNTVQEYAFMLTNPGQRYVAAYLQLPHGMTTPTPMIELLPGHKAQVALTLDMNETGIGITQETIRITHRNETLATLPITASIELQAPDGTFIQNEQELGAWCEHHWNQATTWLYNNLSDTIEFVWGKASLARAIDARIRQHPQDHDAGLESVLGILNPQRAEPTVALTPDTLDFGNMSLWQPKTQSITMTNTGTTYVSLHLAAQNWLIPTVSAIKLRPGQSENVFIQADLSQQNVGGVLQTTLHIKASSGQSFQIPARVRGVLQTPDNTILPDTNLKDLVDWCEKNWERAADWLSSTHTGALPRQIAWAWGLTNLAENLQTLLNRHTNDPHAALDATLATLDPQDFGTRKARIAIEDQRQLDFGKVSSDTPVEMPVTITNTGGRYARVNIQSPGWVPATPVLLSLTPGQTTTIMFAADRRRFPNRKPHGEVLLHYQAPEPLRIHVKAESPRFSLKGIFATSSSADDSAWKTMREDLAVSSVAFSPDGQLLASGKDDGVTLWNVADGTRFHTLTVYEAGVQGVAFSPGGALIAAGCGDEKIRLWRVRDGMLQHTMSGHNRGVNSIAFSPDGKLLASCSDDETVKLWQVQEDGSLEQTLKLVGHEAKVNSIVFSPDGSLLASGGRDGLLILWRVQDGSLIRKIINSDQYTSGIWSVAFSRDSALLASGSMHNVDDTVRLWRVADGQRVYICRGHNGGIRSVAFSSDNETFASGSDDTAIILWRVSDGSKLRELRGHEEGVRCVTFSPDGRMLVSGSIDRTVRLWLINADERLAY